MNHKIILTLLFITLLFSINSSLADITIHYSVSTGDKILFSISKSGKVRMDYEEKGQKDVYVVYLPEKKKAYFMNLKKKSYYEMDDQHRKRFKQQISKSMELMQKKIAGMPEHQKKMLLQMMPNSASMMEHKPEVIKVGSNIKIKKWNCDKYDVKLNGRTVSHVWATPIKNVDIEKPYIQSLYEANKFLDFGVKNIASTSMEYFFKRMNDIPTKAETLSSNEDKKIMYLEQVNKKGLDSSIFIAPPKGYQKVIPQNAPHL